MAVGEDVIVTAVAYGINVGENAGDSYQKHKVQWSLDSPSFLSSLSFSFSFSSSPIPLLRLGTLCQTVYIDHTKANKPPHSDHPYGCFVISFTPPIFTTVVDWDHTDVFLVWVKAILEGQSSLQYYSHVS
jgi:hypothetical protein